MARKTPRTPEFDGTETSPTWGDVDKTFGSFVDAYADNPDEIEHWDDLSNDEQSRIVARSLNGTTDASTYEEAMVLPCVNPDTDNLSRPGLMSCIRFAPRTQGIDEDATQKKARELVAEHFETGKTADEIEVPPLPDDETSEETDKGASERDSEVGPGAGSVDGEKANSDDDSDEVERGEDDSSEPASAEASEDADDTGPDPEERIDALEAQIDALAGAIETQATQVEAALGAAQEGSDTPDEPEEKADTDGPDTPVESDTPDESDAQDTPDEPDESGGLEMPDDDPAQVTVTDPETAKSNIDRSGVAEPQQSADGEFEKHVEVLEKSQDEQIARGAVLIPLELDHQGDFMRSETIGMLRENWTNRVKERDAYGGVMHCVFPPDDMELVEDRQLDAPETIGDRTLPAGTWVQGWKYNDDDLWELVKDGILGGFSIGGVAKGMVYDKGAMPAEVVIPDPVQEQLDEAGLDRDDIMVREITEGRIYETSTVDLPAVPNAVHAETKDLSKAAPALTENLVAARLYLEERGHSPDDARRLAEYLQTRKEATGPGEGEGEESGGGLFSRAKSWFTGGGSGDGDRAAVAKDSGATISETSDTDPRVEESDGGDGEADDGTATSAEMDTEKAGRTLSAANIESAKAVHDCALDLLGRSDESHGRVRFTDDPSDSFDIGAYGRATEESHDSMAPDGAGGSVSVTKSDAADAEAEGEWVENGEHPAATETDPVEGADAGAAAIADAIADTDGSNMSDSNLSEVLERFDERLSTIEEQLPANGDAADSASGQGEKNSAESSEAGEEEPASEKAGEEKSAADAEQLQTVEERLEELTEAIQANQSGGAGEGEAEEEEGEKASEADDEPSEEQKQIEELSKRLEQQTQVLEQMANAQGASQQASQKSRGNGAGDQLWGANSPFAPTGGNN